MHSGVDRRDDFDGAFALAYLVTWILGTVVTARVARARMLTEWVLAFALMTGATLVVGILGAYVALGLLGI
jgi:hypothetical protein